jgi:hypothetical protein
MNKILVIEEVDGEWIADIEGLGETSFLSSVDHALWALDDKLMLGGVMRLMISDIELPNATGYLVKISPDNYSAYNAYTKDKECFASEVEFCVSSMYHLFGDNTPEIIWFELLLLEE